MRGSEGLSKKLGVRRNVSESNLARTLKGNRGSVLSSPRQHISSLEVAKIIKETQIAMMLNANPMIV